ncbi:MAG: class I tRNA ligase family protein, partial [Planctomycetota bacterium]
IEGLRFNTAISTLIEFVNAAFREPDKLTKSQALRFVQLLAPLAPHIAEELWDRLGRKELLAYAAWPEFDAAMTVDNVVEIAVQITGKVRARINVATDAGKDAILADAKAAVADYLKGKTIVKEIVVPGKIVNFVVK